MSRKWWFILTAMLVMATLYRKRLRAYLEQASANVPQHTNCQCLRMEMSLRTW